MGTEAVTRPRRAFYALPGSVLGDLLTVLHPPYTAWHLSYVAIGASLAPAIDWFRLTGTLAAFAFGLGLGAHALDELHGRPLQTRLGDAALWALAALGFAVSIAVAIAGAFVISPWLLLVAMLAILMAAGYALEWHPYLHSEVGFSLSWGGFPVLVGYWAQTERLAWPALAVAAAAVLLGMAQRSLSTPARFVRRSTSDAEACFTTLAGTERWTRRRLLATWERPLRLLAWSMVVLAVGLLVVRG